MAKKKAAPATAVVPKPTPKAVVFPELSEKNHIRCDTFLEDQVLLLNVCVSVFAHPCIQIQHHLSECFHSSRVPNLCRLYRQSASGTDPAQETRGGS